ncbi:MAG: hypothetical protein ABEJ79_08245 [Halolamina sp.]
MSEDRQLPPIIDFGDALDKVAADLDGDEEAEAYLEEIREGLDDLAARAPGNRDPVVDSVENLIDSLLTYADGDAEMWARTIKNRFATYRRSRRTTSTRLHVSSGRLERDGEALDGDAAPGEASLQGTLVNSGEATDAMVAIAFYDERGRATWKVESREYAVGPGEKRPVDLTVYVPEEMAYYAIDAFEPDDPAAVGGDAPTPGSD